MTTTFTPTATPPSLTALFTMRSDFCADLSLTTRGAFGTIITVLHEGLHDVAVHILIGDDSLALSVQDGESLTIMARCEGTIIGCGVFEVDTSTSVSKMGILLIPRALSNLILKAVLSMAISIITDTEAGSDQAVKTALEHGRLVLFAGRMQ